MSKLSITFFAATLALACAAMFADAQTAPKPKAPATADKPAAAAAAPAPGVCSQCACGMAAAHGGMMHGGGMLMQDDRHARHRELATLADIKVQNTKAGATIQLVAKNPADAAKLQELAKDLTASLSEPAHPEPKH